MCLSYIQILAYANNRLEAAPDGTQAILVALVVGYDITANLILLRVRVANSTDLGRFGSATLAEWELTSNNLLSVFISVSDADTGTKFSISALPLKCDGGIFWRLAVSPSCYFQLGQVIHLKSQKPFLFLLLITAQRSPQHR